MFELLYFLTIAKRLHNLHESLLLETAAYVRLRYRLRAASRREPGSGLLLEQIHYFALRLNPTSPVPCPFSQSQIYTYFSHHSTAQISLLFLLALTSCKGLGIEWVTEIRNQTQGRQQHVQKCTTSKT